MIQDGEALPPSGSSNNPQQTPPPDSDLLALDDILRLLETPENKYLKPRGPSFITVQKNLSPIPRVMAWIRFRFRGKLKIEAALEELRSHNKHLQQRFHMQLAIQALQQNKTSTIGTPSSNVIPNPQHFDTLTSGHSPRSIHSNAAAEYGETLSESTSNIPSIGSPGVSIIHTSTEFGTPSDLGEINESINPHTRTQNPCAPSNFGTSCRIPADSDGGFDLQSLRSVASEERWDNCSMNSYVLQIAAVGSP